MEIKRAKRTQWMTFLDTTPTAEDYSWVLLGKGVSEYAIAYNPQITTEKDIISDNATSSHDSNQKQGDVSQKIYSGDPCYEYMDKLRDKIGADVQGHILDIDILHGEKTQENVMKYPAKMSNCITPVTQFLGEDATIEYSIYYNGDPIEGFATITNGVPTFTPSVN